MKAKKEIIRFLKPSLPKIIIYSAFFFISPATLQNCNGTCNQTFTFLAGYKLSQNTSYTISIPMMIGLFLISYIMACMISYGFSYLKKKRMTLK